MDPFVYIIYTILLVFLIALSAVFSFSEMAISSSNKTRLITISEDEKQSNSKRKKAKKAIHFIENYNEHVTAIVIFNNIVDILFSTLATVFFIMIAEEIDPGNDMLGPLMSFLITTPLIIIFGEILPKQLAKKYSESGTMAFTVAITVSNSIMKPFTLILSKIIKEEDNTALSSDDEINIAISQARKAGVTTSFEENLIKRLLATDDIAVKEIMIPKEDVVTIPYDISIDNLTNFLKKQSHTRFPVIGEDGEPVSIFTSRNFLIDKIKNNLKSLKKYQFKFTTFGLDENPYHILEALRNRREKMAIIVNDDNKFVGVVALEDIIELLFGEIYDEADVQEDGVYALNDFSFILNENVQMAYWAKEYTQNIKLSPKIGKMTIKEWVNSSFEDKPEHGDNFTYKNLIIWIRKDNHDSKKLVYEIDIV